MPPALLQLVIAIPMLAWHLLRALPAEGWGSFWKRLPLYLLFWLVFTLMNLLHLAGHLLDEILFPSWRKAAVRGPVFILGIPRSGTTWLQRVLASDQRFTTFSTWEAVLAPSLTEKYLYHGLGLVLKPLETMTVAVRRKILHRMDDIHRIRLLEPEEDFLVLLPLQACFLFAFLCPNTSHYWKLAWFDRAFSPSYRRMIMNYYEACIKKHLYFHQRRHRERTFLSKNPSFTSLTGSLLERFPDAKIIACTRSPEEVLPSQLSSLRPVMKLIGKGALQMDIQDKLIGVLHHYYAILQEKVHSKSVALVPMEKLRSCFLETMLRLLGFLSLECHGERMQILHQAHEESGSYTSSHSYSLDEFSLSHEGIEEEFKDVWPLPASIDNFPPVLK